MPTVTEILETFPEKELVDWKLRVGLRKVKEVSEDALRVGTLLDQWVKADLGFPPSPPSPTPSLSLPTPPGVPGSAEAACWQAWQRFKSERPEQWRRLQLGRELIQGQVCGHPDFSTTPFGVCDLKCASQIRPIYWTQVAAYSWLRNPEINAESLAILRLDRNTGGYEYMELLDPDQIDYEVQVWLNYKVLYEHRRRVADRARIMREEEAYDGVA